MFFTSTRSRIEVSAAFAIAKGLAADGGLFVPSEFPRLDGEKISALCKMDYRQRAAAVLQGFLNDFSAAEVARCVDGAYCGTFENDDPAPLKEVAPGMNVLELWHGPTCAFKDMALQLLPYLLTTAAAKMDTGKETVILVATSGDTGKAALEGFADVPGTKIIVFYPRDGVSDMQKLQMTTQQGGNVAVCGIAGNFDDAQTGVKNIFADPEMAAALQKLNMEFSSANSINFGRLVPQIVYYVSAYCDLLNRGAIANGEAVNVCVPTGNFGNILAAYYAKLMGLPVKRFICASNTNNVLTDFITTGTYDRNRKFYTTSSPSMDILISSNLERLLYHLYDNDSAAVSALMTALKQEGKYTISPEALKKLQAEFYGGFTDENATAATIRETFAVNNYLCDTHTAVAVNVYHQYRRETGDDTPCIVASTASPYKFAPAVLAALTGDAVPDDGFEQMRQLAQTSATAIPAPLAALAGKKVLHSSTVDKSDMRKFILEFLQK